MSEKSTPPPVMHTGMGGVDSVNDVDPRSAPGLAGSPLEAPHSEGQFGPMMRRKRYGPVYRKSGSEGEVYHGWSLFIRQFLSQSEIEARDRQNGVYFRDTLVAQDPRRDDQKGYDYTSPSGPEPWRPPAHGEGYDSWPAGFPWLVRLIISPIIVVARLARRLL